MTLETQVHDLEVRVRKLERENVAIKKIVENLTNVLTKLSDIAK